MKIKNAWMWIVTAVIAAAATTPIDINAIHYKQDALTRLMQANEKTSAFTNEANTIRINNIKTNGVATPLVMSPWHYQGPVKLKNFKDASDYEKKFYSITEKDKWQVKNDWKDGKVINFQKQDGNAAHYLCRTITVSEAQDLPMSLGSDDGLSVWVNGKRILHKDASRGAQPDQEKCVAKLKKGENTILLRVFNRNGATGYYFNCDPKLPTQPDWDALVQKYPEDGGLINSYHSNFGPKWLATDKPIPLVKNAVKTFFHQNMWKEIEPEFNNISEEQSLILMVKYITLKNNLDNAKVQLPLMSTDNLLKAIDDLEKNHPGQLKNAAELRKNVESLKTTLPTYLENINKGEIKALIDAQRAIDIQKEIIYSYPEIAKLKDVLVIKRKQSKTGISHNYNGHTSMRGGFYGFDNEIGKIDVSTGKYEQVYHPKQKDAYIGDIELYFDAKKLLCTMPSEDKKRLQVYELDLATKQLTELTPKGLSDVDNYEGMYLPDDRIIFTSTATFIGVPCVSGNDYVGNIHLLNKDGTVRRLCYDQDNNWCPVLLEDGRVLYLRWEYTDSAHYFSRILMHMNPDGTAQNEFYGSNSYWPNCLFYARPIPGSTTKFVAVVTGHHTARQGELYLFDTTKGREETQGVIQQIAPHNMQGSSLGLVLDRLIDGYNENPEARGRYVSITKPKKPSFPRFLFPHPLSEMNYVVTGNTQDGQWGLYFIDLNGNMTLIARDKDYFFFEPTPLEPTKRPPIIPDHVNLADKQATVYIQDIYEGTGLTGVPRGSVKSLRIFQYEYSYRNMGGHYVLGMESGWDVRRILGTVPVNEDGSAIFKIPANTPIAIQPLDDKGRAMQQMRSWTVGMPGEMVQCVGCHERQNQTVRPVKTMASRQAPVDPEPFYGPTRGFSFNREIQPVLNRYCISCHNPDNPKTIDLKTTEIVREKGAWKQAWGGQSGFSRAYWNLIPYVRRNGPEGNYKILIPNEFNPHTSELVQILEKGHHGVQLDSESWDRLYTWIDINVPFHGTWTEVAEVTGTKIPQNFEQRRAEFRKLYSNVDEDIEAKERGNPYNETPVTPIETAIPKMKLTAQNWPLTEAQAKELQTKAGGETKVIDLGNNQKLTFVRIPSGEFNMGSETGARDEVPVTTVVIEKPFWMCTTEISLADYKQFDPNHTNYILDQHNKDQVRPGYDMDKHPEDPVFRVSWTEANAFCKWLSEKTGNKVMLPTEAQWEWAARAGTASPLWFGDLKIDFAKFANMADRQIYKFAVMGVDPHTIGPNEGMWDKSRNLPNKHFDFLPKIDNVDDGYMITSPCNEKQPNTWGLKNMNGNVVEWCRDVYRPYPYKTVESDTNTQNETLLRSARGGSWYDRPYRCTSSYRYYYPAWQKVFNVGFRPIIEE